MAGSPEVACFDRGPTPESWFAYRLAIADVGAPHVLEADYPDDAKRTFLVTVHTGDRLTAP